MGRRPWKYLTPEERAEARREQVRQNVRAYRERNKAKKSESQSVSEIQSPTGATSTLSDTSTVQGRNEKQRVDARLPLTPASSSSSTSIVTLAESNLHLHQNYFPPPSPVDTDVNRHSELAPIDISFGTLQAVVEDLERVAPIWPWSLAAQTLYSDDRLVDVGILCAGYRILGKLRCDQQTTEHAWLPYHRALQQLQRVRLHEVLPLEQAFCALTATASMTLFDATGRDDSDEEYNAAQAGSFHMRATSELFNRLGPEAFRSPLGLEVLRLRKVQRNLVCLAMRQPSFFSDPKWRTEPFIGIPATLGDDFWLFAEQLPGMFFEIDKMRNDMTITDSARLDITLGYLHRLSTIKHEFDNWLAQLAAQNHPSPVYWEVPTSLPFHTDPALVNVFPKCYHFADSSTAALMVKYWIFYSHLLRNIFDLLELVGSNYQYLKPSLPHRDTIYSTLLTTYAHIRLSLGYTIAESRSNYMTMMFFVWMPITQLLGFYGSNAERFHWELRFCYAAKDLVEEVTMNGQWKGVLKQMGWGPQTEEVRKRLMEVYAPGGEEDEMIGMASDEKEVRVR